MRSGLLLSCLLAAFAVTTGAPLPSSDAGERLDVTSWTVPDSDYDAILGIVADETGVPQGLLAALAQEASGFDPHPGVESMDHAYGLMGLRDGFDPSLLEASEASGIPVADLKDGDLSNVRGGASLLLAWAEDPEDVEDPAVWVEALQRFSGAGLDATRTAFASRVLHAWNNGVMVETSWGGVVMTEPLGANLTGIVPDPDGGDRSDDYGPAAWSAAASCNYSNYSRGFSDVDYVVIHTVQGSYSGCISWFQNCSAGASAHYVVSAGGSVTQMVDEADVAWHAGNWDYNVASIGIEHEGYIDDPSDYTDALYAASAALTCDICDNYGIPCDRSHVIGHNEIPDPYNPGEYGGAGHHTDPGGYWDWDYYMGLVATCGGGGGTPVGDLTGYIRQDDIYTGANIVGATVTLNTGATTTTGSDGRYSFYDLAEATYTVTASASGYNTGVDSKTIEPYITNWKSMALTVASGGDDDATPPPDDDTTPAPDDDTTPSPDDDTTASSDDDTTLPPGDDDTVSGDDDTVPGDDDSQPPSYARHPLDATPGCSGCDAGAPAAGQWEGGGWLLLVFALRRSRRLI